MTLQNICIIRGPTLPLMTVFSKEKKCTYNMPFSFCMDTGLVTMLELLLYSLGYTLLVIERRIADFIVSTFLYC